MLRSQCGGKSFSEMRQTFSKGDVPLHSKTQSKTKGRSSGSRSRPETKAQAKKSKGRDKSKAKSNGKSKDKSKDKSKSKAKPRRRVSRSLTRKRRTSKEKLTKPKLTKPKHCGCGSHTYTGKEMTPRGLGKCEECLPENVVLRGVDETLYRNQGGTWTKIL